MKLIKEYWREALLTVLLMGAVSLVYYWTVDRPDGVYEQSFMLLGVIGCLVGSFYLVKSLWRDKWRKVATRSLQRVFARLQRFFERFADRIGIKRVNKSVLGGKTTVILHRTEEREAVSAGRSAKPPKWKHLANERERMRYIYRQMISGKLKRGARIFACDTPCEIMEKQENTSSEEALLEIYVEHRYDERSQPDGEEIERLKKELEIK